MTAPVFGPVAVPGPAPRRCWPGLLSRNLRDIAQRDVPLAGICLSRAGGFVAGLTGSGFGGLFCDPVARIDAGRGGRGRLHRAEGRQRFQFGAQSAVFCLQLGHAGLLA